MDEKSRDGIKDATQLVIAIGAAILANLVVNQMPWEGQLFMFIVAGAMMIGGTWVYLSVADLIPAKHQPKWLLRQRAHALSEQVHEDIETYHDSLAAFSGERDRLKRQEDLIALKAALKRPSIIGRLMRLSSKWKR